MTVTSKKMGGLTIVGALLLWPLMLVTPAHGDLYSFYSITNNRAADAAIGEAQLGVDVTDATDQNGAKVLFTFLNSGGAASSITDVYFDGGSLLGIASVINGPGVNFSQGASPGNLPGGRDASPPFITTAGLSADSNPPTQPNGVNPGQSLGILFNLQTRRTFGDVIGELNDASLRVGIHVQGFAQGGSESFINNVPLPGAVLLGLLGLVAAGRKLRKAC